MTTPYDRLDRIGKLASEMQRAHYCGKTNWFNEALGKVLYELEALRLDLEAEREKEECCGKE